MLKKELKMLLDGKPAGTYAVFKGRDPKIDRDLLAIGWNFSESSTMFFVATADAGSTAPGEPYKVRFPDWFGNVVHRNVPRPKILNTFFKGANVIDRHNNLRQGALRLEEKWITKDGHFRILTTLLGMNVTDTFLLAKHHNLLGPLKNSGMDGMDVSIVSFASVVLPQSF